MVRLAEYAREEINRIGGYYAYSRELCDGDSIYDFDVTKLSVNTLDIGLAGIEVYDLLRDDYNIQIEFGILETSWPTCPSGTAPGTLNGWWELFRRSAAGSAGKDGSFYPGIH